MTVANVNVTKVLFKRGNTVQNNNYTGVSGEISIDTQTKTLRVHDGITPGGNILTTGGIYGNSNVTTYLTSVAGNIIPSANVTYSLGNATNQWRDLWVSNNTIYIGNIPITVSNGSLLINGNSVTGGTGTDDVLRANVGAYQIYANANAVTQTISINSINANITAANSAIQTLSANIGTLVAGAPGVLDTLLELGNALGNSDSFSSTMVNWLGNITSNVTAANTSINTFNANLGSFQTYANLHFLDSSYGNSNVASYLPTYTGNIAANITRNNYTWTFGTDGNLTFPAGGHILDSQGNSVLGTVESSYKGFRAHYGTMYDNTDDENGPINKLVIYKSTATPSSAIDADTSSDDFQVTGLTGSDVVAMLVVISDGTDWDVQTPVEDLKAFVEAVIDEVILDGGVEGDVRSIANMKAAFYSNFNNFSTIISNVKTQLEFFSVNDQFNISPAFATGKGATFSGISYNMADNTLDLGSWGQNVGTHQLGDVFVITGNTIQDANSNFLTTPANDVTVTITNAPDGYIGSFTVTGTLPRPAEIWPSNSISDGGDDEYDGANAIHTDLDTEISYNDGNVVTSSSAFGGGDYVVTYQAGIFGIFATNAGIDIIGTSGDTGGYGNDNSSSGFDGDGIAVTGSVYGPLNINLTLTGNIVSGNSRINFVANSSGDGYGSSTIQLIPSTENTVGPDQYLIIDPTSPNHIHIRAGGTQDNSQSQLFLGGENSHFRVDSGLNPNVYISANGQTWMFGANGTTQFPDETINAGTDKIDIKSSSYAELWFSAVDGDWQDHPTWNQNAYVYVQYDGLGINNVRGADGNGGATWNHTWRFDNDGSLQLPLGGNIAEGGGITGAIKLTPAGGANSNQALLIYPTGAADGDHIHLTAGGGSTELYLGDDSHYVKLGNNGNIEIRATAQSPYATAAWTFDTDGVLTAPNIVIAGNTNLFGSYTALIQPTNNLPIATISSGTAGGITSVWVEDLGDIANSNIAAIYTPLAGTGTVRVAAGSNATSVNLWDFNPDGNLILPESGYLKVGSGIVAGFASSPAPVISGFSSVSAENFRFQSNGVNILSTVAGTYSNTNVSAYLSTITSGNVGAGNLTVINNFSSNVITANSFTYANGVNILSTVAGTYSDANVATYLPTYTGNIAGNIVKNGYTWTFSNTGTTTFPTGVTLSNARGPNTVNFTTAIDKSFQIETQTSTTGRLWSFGTDGNLTLPQFANINFSNGVNILSTISAGSTYSNVNVEAYIGGNIGAFQTYANANAATQATSINTINNTLTNTNVAIGYGAGATSQGDSAVAIGEGAGSLDQGLYSVAIGNDAGTDNQGDRSVAVGTGAGRTNQGNYAVAIGRNAGYTNQGNNSIIINATTSTLNQITANTFTVAPVRNDVSNVAQVLFYNTTNKEITYGNTINIAGNINAAQYNFANGVNILSSVTAVANLSTLTGNISWTAVGANPPTFTTSSNGTKIVLWPSISSTMVDYAIGIEAGNTWFSIPQATNNFGYKWYAGNTTIATLSGNGTLTTGNITTTGNISATNFVGNGVGLTNVTVSAAGNIVGTSSNVTLVAGNYSYTFDNTGNVTLPANVFVGVTNTFLPNTVASFSANVNYYSQVTLQNKSSGNDATADYIVTANNGSDTVNFLDLGIINSGYDNTTPSNSLGNIVFAADSYIYAQGNTSNANQSGGNLAIGTATTGKTIKFFAGGTTSSAIAMTVANTGVTVGGSITATGTFSGSGSGLTGVALKTTGSWTVTTGTGTYSFTVPASGTYQLWVDCNIPNGILVWNATATVTNTNVPVVGAQYAWVYNGGGSPIDFTSIPNQFTGTGNTIVRSSTAPSATTNRFDFGFNNTSGGNVTVRYGWVAIS
jgi:hypothetical protein